MRTYGTKSFSSRKKAKTGRYAFSYAKLSKMLRLVSVAEAHGLIYPRPSGENFSFAAERKDVCQGCCDRGEMALIQVSI